MTHSEKENRKQGSTMGKSRKTRFLTALKGGIPDRIPMYDFLFNKDLYNRLLGRRPENYNARDAVECALALDHDGVFVPFGGGAGYGRSFISTDTYRDEWGTTFRRTGASWPLDAPIDYPISDKRDLARLHIPDPSLAGRTAEIEIAAEMENDGIAILAGVQGPFTTAWHLMGYERICYSLYDDPGLLTEVFRISNEFFIEASRRSVNSGCDGIWVSEDLGDSHSVLCSIEHFKRYVLPYLAELVERVDGLGVPAILHSCGNIMDFLGEIQKTKICAVHPLQRTAGMDLKHMKREFGKRFCLIGNIDSSRTLAYGTLSDVENEVRESIDIAAKGGGYVLASDHSIHTGIPVENAIQMFRTCKEYGRGIYGPQ